MAEGGGGGRIRTCEARRRQIYSLLVLAAHPPLRVDVKLIVLKNRTDCTERGGP